MTKLWAHQLDGVRRLEQPGPYGLFFGMGAGKTRTALEYVRTSNHLLILVVMPKSVLDDYVWPREIQRMGDEYLDETHHTFDKTYYWRPGMNVVNLLQGTARTKANLVKQMTTRTRSFPIICFVNYESVWRGDLGKAILATPWDCVILDEAHRIKAAGSTVSKWFAMLQRHWPNAKRIALSGTPTPNSPLDAYGLYRWLDPTIFGTRYNDFQNRYAQMGGFNNMQVLYYRNQDELRERMCSIAHFVTTSEVIDLPATHHVYRWTNFENAEQRRIYDELDEEFITEVKGPADAAAMTIMADNTLVKALRLQQFTSGFSQVTAHLGLPVPFSKAKMNLLNEVLDELPRSEYKPDLLDKSRMVTRIQPVVIFCRFIHDIDEIAALCRKRGLRYGEYSGRRKQLDDWRLYKFEVLIIQMQSGSEGIDLTHAAYTIYYSKAMGYGLYEQSLARIHRPGQYSPVTYVHLGVRNTIDAVMEKALSEKMELIDYIRAYGRGDSS